MNRTLLTLLAALSIAFPAFADDGKACELVTDTEIQAVIGVKPALKPSVLPTGVETCSGKASGWTVNVRLFKKGTEAELEKVKEGIETLKKSGATVEPRRMSGMDCLSVSPGGKAARQPYTTSCTATKKPNAATIEVSHPSQSIEVRKLVPLAEQMTGCFWQVTQ